MRGRKRKSKGKRGGRSGSRLFGNRRIGKDPELWVCPIKFRNFRNTPKLNVYKYQQIKVAKRRLRFLPSLPLSPPPRVYKANSRPALLRPTWNLQLITTTSRITAALQPLQIPFLHASSHLHQPSVLPQNSPRSSCLPIAQQRQNPVSVQFVIPRAFRVSTRTRRPPAHHVDQEE